MIRFCFDRKAPLIKFSEEASIRNGQEQDCGGPLSASIMSQFSLFVAKPADDFFGKGYVDSLTVSQRIVNVV